MRPPKGSRFTLTVSIARSIRPGGLAYTFPWDPPTPDDQETVVTLTFEPLAQEETRLLVEHGPFRTNERYALHKAGWNDTLDRLEAWISANPT